MSCLFSLVAAAKQSFNKPTIVSLSANNSSIINRALGTLVDDHSGFAIRHGNRQLPTRFKNLEEAELALEMFNIRRRRRDEAADYIDEA